MQTATPKKRIKEVFKDVGEVAHKWASQSQLDGRSPTRNIFFHGPTIYSYGHHFPMATFVDGKLAKRLNHGSRDCPVVLLTTRDYSVTTAKHKNATRSAASHCIRVYCKNVEARTLDDHRKNIETMVENIKTLAAKHKKANTSDYRGNIASAIQNLSQYVKLFRIRQNKELKSILALANDSAAWAILTNTSQEVVEAKEQRYEQHRREIASAEQFKQEQRLEQIKHLTPLAVSHWRSGGSYNDRLAVPNVSEQWFYVSSVLYDLPTMLRIKDGQIETSHQARISIETAKRIWPTLQAKQNPGDVEGYRGVGFNHAQEFVIGCHRIPYCELELMAIELGLVESPCNECKEYSIEKVGTKQ